MDDQLTGVTSRNRAIPNQGMQDLPSLSTSFHPFPLLSCPFFSFPALSSPFVPFTAFAIFWWIGGRFYMIFSEDKKADIQTHRQKDILFYYYIRCDQLGNQDVTYFTVYTGWLFVGILMKTKGGKG